MKLEDILKSKGWTDADLAAVAPMLADARFRASMEETFGAISSERDELKQRDSQWQERLDNEWQPRVTAREQELAQARIQLAAAEEKIKIARDFGYLDEQKVAEADAKAAQAQIAAAGAFDPKKFVSMDDVPKLLEGERRAILMVNNLQGEYGYLTGGQNLYEYETEIDGRKLRGVEALSEEARMAREPDLRKFVAKKFDFDGKRAAIAAKRQQEHDEAIRKDEAEKVRAELASQYGNPMMRTAVPSRMPFFEKKADGKQPWEVGTESQLKQNRIERAMKAQLTGQLQ